jgi:hypothetical protein
MYLSSCYCCCRYVTNGSKDVLWCLQFVAVSLYVTNGNQNVFAVFAVAG